METSTLLGIGVAVVLVVGIAIIVTRVMGLARRHSRWSVSVHFAERPAIDVETVNRALTAALPGTKLSSALSQPNQWVAAHPEDGQYVVKLQESSQEPSPTAPTKFRVDLSVIAPKQPSEAEHEALLEKLCRLAVPFARKGAGYVSKAVSFPSASDTPVVKKLDAPLLEKLAAGRADVFAAR